MGLVLALAMAGCVTDGDEDAVPTPTTTTPDTSADLTPAPTTDGPTEPTPDRTPWPEPTRPPEMARDDIEGAKAAAVYFIELHQYVYATGDVQEWEAMSHPECQFCSGATSHVVDLYESGGYAVGGVFAIDDIVVVPPDSEFAHYRVGISGTEAPSEEYSEDGASLRNFDGADVDYVVAVLRTDDNWTVRGVAIDE